MAGDTRDIPHRDHMIAAPEETGQDLAEERFMSTKHQMLTAQVVCFLVKRSLDELAQLSRDELAEIFDVNASYLSVRFKRDTGQTLRAFIEREKLFRTRMLLENYPGVRMHELCSRYGTKKYSRLKEKFVKAFFISPHKMLQALR